MYRLLLPMLLFAFTAHALDTLSGDIGGRELKPAKGPFIVRDNITVPEGKKTVIKAGCVFLFRPYTGLAVNGAISVEGTQESPVVFTSFSNEKYAKDAKESPKPFDWNGIFVSSKADDVRFHGFILEYSVYGIKSQKEDISVEEAIFKANGQFHFTLKDKIKDVTDGIPYNFTGEQKITAPPAVPARPKKPNTALMLATGITGIAAGAGAIVSFITVRSANTDYKNEFDPQKQVQLENRFNKFRIAGYGCCAAAAVCIPLSAILFIRNITYNKKTVTVYLSPDFDNEMKLGINVHF
jgi:hypothetical protein